MKFTGKNLIRIDRLFAVPHLIAGWIPFLFSPEKKNDDNFVLVIKFMGMGSIARWIALCEEHNVDKGKVVLITFARHRELCELFGCKAWYIRTESPVSFLSDCWRIVRETGKLRPSFIVDYERCSHSVSLFRKVLSWKSGARSISFGFKTKSTTGREIKFPAEELSLEELMIKGIDVMPKTSSVTASEGTATIQKNKILINSNVSDYLLARRYPADYFIQTVKSLHNINKELQFYFTGSAAEKDYVNQILTQLEGIATFNTCGQWNVEKLMNELAVCAVFITGDSGPLHLAAYLRIPVVGLWGPTQPGHFGYLHHHHLHHLTLQLACSPCFKHPASKPAVFCHGKITCFANLLPLKVVETVLNLLMVVSDNRAVHLPAGMKLIPKIKAERTLA